MFPMVKNVQNYIDDYTQSWGQLTIIKLVGWKWDHQPECILN